MPFIPSARAWIAIAWGASITGCTSLSGDCELNLTCPATTSATTTSATTTSTTTTSSTTTSSATPMCGDVYKGPCDDCLQASCCQETADCIADGECLNYCLLSVWPPVPQCEVPATAAALTALTTCMADKCSPVCDAKDYCNPVTNSPCPTNGTACDAAYPGVFLCLPPYGTPVALCGGCNNAVGPYCDAGMRCHAASNKCARYCCNDADCGTGKCILDTPTVFGAPLANPMDLVGICLDQAGTTPACDAPAMAPSNGACVGGFPP